LNKPISPQLIAPIIVKTYAVQSRPDNLSIIITPFLTSKPYFNFLTKSLEEFN
jgi:hypothetical protein